MKADLLFTCKKLQFISVLLKTTGLQPLQFRVATVLSNLFFDFICHTVLCVCVCVCAYICINSLLSIVLISSVNEV